MPGKIMTVTGYIVLGLGVLLMMAAFGARTTAEFSDTLNIGLLNDKSNSIAVACTALICGVLFIVGGSIVSTLDRLLSEDESEEDVTETV